MTKRLLLLLVALIGAPAAFAGIFVPLNYNGPGAYGSQWHTSVIVSNRSGSTLAGPGVLFSQCFVAPDFCGASYLYSGSTGKLLSDAPHGIYINSESGNAAFATVHIAAEPRDPDTEGTEIPIARDDDFGTSMKLINVPTGVASGHPVRALLRLYALLSGGTGLPNSSGTVIITAYDVKNPGVAATQIEVTLTAGGLSQPAYAEVDLSRFASIAPFVNLDVDAGHLSPDIQVHFPSSTMNVWGFATVTDNATNDVITITAR
jgi:hypothetical protein